MVKKVPEKKGKNGQMGSTKKVKSSTQKIDDIKNGQSGNPALDVIPQVLWLLTQSPKHKYMFLADMKWYFMPPFRLKQFRVFYKDRQPIAYACWAFVSDAVNERLCGGMIRLRPNEWRGGNNAWLVDLVAPYGGGDVLIMKLKEQVFEGHKVKTLAPNSTGKPAVIEL